jgi:cytochrome c'
MQQALTALNNALPARRAQVLQTQSGRLAQLARTVASFGPRPPKRGGPGGPAFSVLASQLAQQTAQLSRGAQANQFGRLRPMLNQVQAACTACHRRFR